MKKYAGSDTRRRRGNPSSTVHNRSTEGTRRRRRETDSDSLPGVAPRVTRHRGGRDRRLSRRGECQTLR